MNDLPAGSEGGATRLMSGIITDAKQLITQQLDLLRHEVKDDLRLTKQAGLTLIYGTQISLVGGILLALMLVHWLSWAAPELSLSVCYGIVAVPIAVLGGVLLLVGLHKFRSLDPMTGQSGQALMETLQWKTHRK